LFLETVSLMSPDPLMDVYWFSDASLNTPSSEFSEKLLNIDLEAHKWEVHSLSRHHTFLFMFPLMDDRHSSSVFIVESLQCLFLFRHCRVV
jgi:hypothetical protein